MSTPYRVRANGSTSSQTGENSAVFSGAHSSAGSSHHRRLLYAQMNRLTLARWGVICQKSLGPCALVCKYRATGSVGRARGRGSGSEEDLKRLNRHERGRCPT